MSQYTERGVVLRTYRLGEADRIVVMYTEHTGKVRAVAKGVRRTSSKFGGRMEPLCHVALLCWHGRGDLDIVTQAELVDYFPHVRADLDRMTHGLSLLEVVDQLAPDRHPDPALYTMLVGALGALDNPGRDPLLVAPAFFLKALVLDGAGPVLDGCAACGRPEGEVELVAFTATEGGALCRSCRRGRPLSPDALALLRRILEGDLAAVLAGPPPPGAPEVAALATDAVEAHVERQLRTVRTVSGL